MDKKKFLENAPLYYALAIMTLFKTNGGRAASESEVSVCFIESDESSGPDEFYNYLEEPLLLAKALEWLQNNEVIEFLEDDFGPNIYKPTDIYSDKIEFLVRNIDVFNKYYSIANSTDWLKIAISNVNKTYNTLKITEEDLRVPDRDWEPLPLERDSDEIQNAIRSVDAAVEAIQADNGYCAKMPEERDYVLTSLTALSNKLKDMEAISVAYVRVFGLDPLEKAFDRFKGTAKEFVLEAARESIKELIKWLFKRMSE